MGLTGEGEVRAAHMSSASEANMTNEEGRDTEVRSRRRWSKIYRRKSRRSWEVETGM